MRNTAIEVIGMVKDTSRNEYDRDRKLRLALAHLIQIIGEAANHLSDAFQISHPEIPWEDIIGMRNRIVHEYLGIDENLVWDTATQDLEELVQALERPLAEEERKD
jgi:uncharacterized protein with HEPN domain